MNYVCVSEDAEVLPVSSQPEQYEDAQPCKLKRAHIETIAEMATEGHYHPEMRLSELVTAFGGNLVYSADADAPDCASIKVRSDRDFDITLPLSATPEENRFTVAHELGHYVLHYYMQGSGRPMQAYRYGGNEQAEAEANWFASAFLMPNAAVQEVWKESKSVADLALHFHVSLDAAFYRAKYLQLLAD